MKNNTIFISFFSLFVLLGFQTFGETMKERILSLFPMHFTQQELDRLKDQEPVFRNDLLYSMNAEEAQKLSSSYPSKIQIVTGSGFPDRVLRTDIITIESDKAASAAYVAKGAYYGETRFEIKVERVFDVDDSEHLMIALLPEVDENVFLDVNLGNAESDNDFDENSFYMVENNNNDIVEDFDKNIGQFAKATDIDDDTIDSIDLSILAFHFYLQGENKEEFDVAKETTRNKSGLFGWPYVAERHLAQTDPKWDHWYFKPFYGIGGSKLLQSYRAPGVHGMVAFNPSKNLIVVTYRGTQRGKEWLGQNFNFVKKQPVLEGIEGSALKDFDGWVHAGYWNLFETTKDEIETNINQFLSELVDEEERKKVKLLFTGHSLGGATATLAAAYFASHDAFKDLEKEIRTFGAPKVAGEDFKLWLEMRVPGKSFARETDPVPSFPRVSDYLGYYKSIYTPYLLDSFGDTSLNLDAAHDARKYRQAIYTLRNMPYEKMYLKGAELSNN